jgi:hypothetical protein
MEIAEVAFYVTMVVAAITVSAALWSLLRQR